MTRSASSKNGIRVWLVEDNALFSNGVERVVNSLDNMSCTGRFHSVEAAFERFAVDQPPEVILLDVQLPGMDGIEALEKFHELAADSKVVILTVFDDADKIFRAFCAGAAGYILKSSGVEKIGQAIEQVMAGGAPMTPEVAKKVLAAFSRLDPVRMPKGQYHLTERELEILRLMADGMLKKEIAAQLAISIHTVATHLRVVYRKLHVNTNTGAVAKALREGII